MTDIIVQLLEAQPWWVWVSAAISAASAFVAATPTPRAGSTWSKVYKAIELVALNVLRSKDK
tara:strand:+ start:1935 stop:2120 length:186 start_codon:yes stop_codon:yes gene_type:complete